MTIRVAAVSEDGERISSHFGMAPFYQVFTVNDGQVIAQEQRAKPHHGVHPQGDHSHETGHSHQDMFAPVSDCQVLLVGGMGQPAFESAAAAGLEVYLTGGAIQDALQAYLRGELSSDLRRVHRH